MYSGGMENKGFLQTTVPPDWSQMTADRARDDINYALRVSRANIEAIKAVADEDLTFDNSVRALEHADDILDSAWLYLNHLESVMTSPELRRAVNDLLPEVSRFSSSVILDEVLYAKISAFAASKAAENLDGEERILLRETLRDFEEEGANLPPEKKKRLFEINEALGRLGQKFSENELDSTKSFYLHVEDEDGISGVPSTAVEIAAKAAMERGLKGWVFTLDYPSYSPFISYAQSDILRKKIWSAAVAVASEGKFDNRPILAEMLALREEKAKILSFENYADYTLSRRMARSGQRALSFVEDLRAKFAPAFEEEWRRLQEFAKKCGCGEIMPWQTAYYAEKMRKSLYDFDPECLRDYFPFNKVLEGLFRIAKAVFGLEICKSDLPPRAWHASVELYDVRRNGKLIGRFYTDFVPRRQKRSGAWMNLLKPACGDEPALGVIAGNLTEPSSYKPALLSFGDVSTLFHEFGHLAHFMLMDAREPALRDVAWDFVELPSQIMENWCADKQCLDMIASHWRTGEKIPDSLFEKFERAQKFEGAMACMRQLSFAKLDLLLHIYPRRFLDSGDLEKAAREAIGDCLHKFSVPVPTILPRFSHIFGGGYAAAYYSYKWAEVLDADAFTRFKKEGLLNGKTGADYVEKILRVGKRVDPEKAFENFMGRPPDSKALVERTLEPDLPPRDKQ